MSEQNQSMEQTQNAPAKKPWYKKWWVIVIGVIIVIAIIGNSGDDNNSSKDNQSQSVAQNSSTEKKTEVKTEEVAEEPVEEVPAVVTTSAEIAKDYSENEVAADEKYKDKMIEVSGKVTGVDNGITDNELIVKLSDGEYDFSGPWCYMKPSEKEKVIALKKGQQVTLIGKGNSATIGSPMIKDCVIK